MKIKKNKEPGTIETKRSDGRLGNSAGKKDTEISNVGDFARCTILYNDLIAICTVFLLVRLWGLTIFF